MGVPIRSEKTQHVLTFETPDQFKKEVEERIDEATARLDLPVIPANSPYEKVQQDYMATLGLDSTVSIREWDLRFNTERQYLSLLKNYLTIFGFDEGKERKLIKEINRSLFNMEGRQSAIEEALRRPSNPEGK